MKKVWCQLGPEEWASLEKIYLYQEENTYNSFPHTSFLSMLLKFCDFVKCWSVSTCQALYSSEIWKCGPKPTSIIGFWMPTLKITQMFSMVP